MVEIRYRQVDFSDLPGWATDDVSAALKPFADCAAAIDSQPYDTRFVSLRNLTQIAVDLTHKGYDKNSGRYFFEENFQPYIVEHNSHNGLLTGYYEPVLKASYVATDQFKIPIYQRPDNLVDAHNDELRGAVGKSFTHFRRSKHGLELFPERSAIEQGALNGLGLELLYVEDLVDAFFLHIQGSGLIILPDGERIRIGYDGKNGYPYTSIGRYVADNGWMSDEDITLDALKTWLKADLERARRTMWQNKSFIFFKVLDKKNASNACGIRDIPLTPGRSLAIDRRFYQMGQPVFVSSPTLDFLTPDRNAFTRLMIAQDVGSAITGPERGDLFFGTGDLAGALAGRTKHHCNFFLLLPKSDTG